MFYALVCSGQGVQNADLLDSLPFGKTALALRESVAGHKDIDPETRACLSDPEAYQDRIYENHFAQPLLSLYQVMIWAELAPLLPKPRVLAGYSLGELAACHGAGALPAEATVLLAHKRALEMDKAGPEGGLIAVTGLKTDRTAATVEGLGYVAIVISESHQVVGFPKKNEASLMQKLTQAGAGNTVSLNVRVASHTPLLKKAVAPFRQILTKAHPGTPTTKLLSGVDASVLTTTTQLTHLIPDQIYRPVRWDKVMERIYASGCRLLLEVGAGNQLSHMFMSAYPDTEARSVAEFRSFTGVAAWLQKRLQGTSINLP